MRLSRTEGAPFRSRWLVRYPNGTPHNVLLTAIAQGMGVETAHVGSAEGELQGGDIGLVNA